MVFQILIDIQRVQILRIKACQQHIHHNRNVYLVLVSVIFVAILLVLDALLHILIVCIKLIHGMVGAELLVVIGNNSHQRGFLLVWFLLIVFLFLWQILLNLHDVAVAFGGRREHAGDVQRLVIAVQFHFLCLGIFEQIVILNGLVDGTCGKQSVEASFVGCSVVFRQNRLHDGGFLHRIAHHVRFIGLEIIHVET